MSNAKLTHETSGETGVSADLSVDLNVAVQADHLDLVSGQRVVEAVTKHDNQRKALTQLVRSSRRARGPHSTKLVKHPMLGGI